MDETKRKRNIVVVEDNEADARLLEEAFGAAKQTIDFTIEFLRDGAEAVEYCNRLSGGFEMKSPDIILLDLNLPKLSGWEVLKRIKNDPKLRALPVVVFTTSNSRSDIIKAYDLCANAFVTKPLKIEDYFETVKAIKEFWLKNAININFSST